MHFKKEALYKFIFYYQFSSVVSDSLQPHESQHAKPLCHDNK